MSDQPTKTTDAGYPAGPTQYGFEWGPAEVIRASSHPKHGVWLLVRSAKQELQIRITRSGLIRVGEPEALS
jgi:hypothetical protein